MHAKIIMLSEQFVDEQLF